MGRIAILNADAVEADVPASGEAVSDELLMLAYAGGDAGSFDALYRRHRDALFRYLLRHTGSRDVSADLCQDVWRKLVEARHRYQPDAPFAAFLFRIAHNRVVDHFRTQRPTDAVPEDLAVNEADGPERRVAGQQVAERFMRALMALPAEQREIIVLREECDLTLEQIAGIQGVGRETVKSRLRYALIKLREFAHD